MTSAIEYATTLVRRILQCDDRRRPSINSKYNYSLTEADDLPGRRLHIREYQTHLGTPTDNKCDIRPRRSNYVCLHGWRFGSCISLVMAPVEPGTACLCSGRKEFT